MNSGLSLVHIVTNDFKSDNRVRRAAAVGCQLFSNVSVLCLHRRSASLLDFEEDECFTVYRTRLATLNWPRVLPCQLIKYCEALVRITILVKKMKPDVVHCHDLSGLIIGSAAQLILKTKIIYDSHEYLVQSAGFLNYPRSVQRILALLERVLAKKSHRVITVSESIATNLSNSFDRKDIVVIRNIPVF